MHWIVLIGSGLFEAAWAASLDRLGNRFSWIDLVTFAATVTISMGGLMWAMREIPVGTGYAVWAGTGAVATIAWSVYSGSETLTPVKVILLTTLVASIVGLRLIEGGPA